VQRRGLQDWPVSGTVAPVNSTKIDAPAFEVTIDAISESKTAGEAITSLRKELAADMGYFQGLFYA
jgi:hypothetical protein